MLTVKLENFIVYILTKIYFFILAGSQLEKAISEGPEALKKFIDSGAIEELHDVMPHNDDDEDLNAAYIDDSEPNPTAALDVTLPTPLQSVKLPLSSNDSKEKTRKSRFSDLNDDSSMDTDLRFNPPPLLQDNYGNGRSDMKNNFQDVDYRSGNFDKDDNMFQNDDYDSQNMPMDVDFRNRYDNYDSEEPNYRDRDRDRDFMDQEWNQNDNFRKTDSPHDFGYQGNQNGSYSSNGPMGNFSSGNFRDFRDQGSRGPFGNNFRPENNWSSRDNRDNYNRNRNNFNQRNQRSGSNRNNQRGRRGGDNWSGSGNNSSRRGRNVF